MTRDIVTYHISIQGKSHIKKGTCCQDASRVEHLFGSCYLAVVADGVGSAKHSQVGSSIAVNTVATYFKQNYKRRRTNDLVEPMLKLAFTQALEEITEEANGSGNPLSAYDTTLSAVIYDGGRIVYAHSGDGAIIGLTSYGDYVEITTAQKGEDAVSVIPLRGGPSQWEIGTSDEEWVSVMLLTDGMFDTICPSLLRANHRSQVYAPLGAFFADPLGFSATEDPQVQLEEIRSFIEYLPDYNFNRFYNRLAAIYSRYSQDGTESYEEIIEAEYYPNDMPLSLMKEQQDDKTVTAIVDLSMNFQRKELSFFREPDWASLREALRKELYPSTEKGEKEGGDGEMLPVLTYLEHIPENPVDVPVRERVVQQVKQAYGLLFDQLGKLDEWMDDWFDDDER